MPGSIALLAAVMATACGTDASGFAGDYETVDLSTQTGGCGGPRDPQPIDDASHFFRLDDVDPPTGRLVGYFPCTELGTCQADYNLYRSFGRSGDAWITTVSTAIDPGCTLQYRVRTLARVDDATIEIDEVLYQEVDPSLGGDACAIAVAKQRGKTMPCVEDTVLLADERTPP